MSIDLMVASSRSHVSAGQHSLAVGNVCHFPPPPGGMPVQAEALTTGLGQEGIRVVQIPTNLRGNRLLRMVDSTRFLRSFVRLPVFLARLCRAIFQVQILHVHSTSGLSFFLFAMPALLLGHCLGKRVLLHFHAGNAEAFFKRWPRLVPAIVRFADEIIVPSSFLQKIFANLGFETVIIPNICPVDRFRTSSTAPERPCFIVARNLEPVYNVSCVIQAFHLVVQQFPEAVLWVLGSGSEEAKLRTQVESMGLEASVKFLGSVKNEEIPGIFEQASIFLNASLWDNQPVSIIEAFAAGLPVISSSVGGIAGMIEHEKTGLLFEVNDYATMADHMIRLLKEPEFAALLAANARKGVSQYSWPLIFKRLAAVYRISAGN